MESFLLNYTCFWPFYAIFSKKESHKRGALCNFVFPLGKMITPNAIFLEDHPKKLYPTIDEVCHHWKATEAPFINRAKINSNSGLQSDNSQPPIVAFYQFYQLDNS